MGEAKSMRLLGGKERRFRFDPPRKQFSFQIVLYENKTKQSKTKHAHCSKWNDESGGKIKGKCFAT